MMRGFDLTRPAGGVLHGYDTGPTGRDDELVVFWHGGTPNTGEPPEPLLPLAAELGIRFLGADRPGYGGTSRDAEADVADVVPDVLAVADAAGVRRFAVLGHSGGGPRVLACAALATDRVLAAVTISSSVPADADGLDRFAGMAPGIVEEQLAVAAGREALLAMQADADFDESAFTPADHAALAGPWGWFGRIVAAAMDRGPDGEADDLLAAGRSWGFDLDAVRLPVLVVHGAEDRMVPAAHGAWLAAHLPAGELRVVPGAGHIAVLEDAPHVLAELRRRAEDPLVAHHLGDVPVRTGDGRDTTVHLGRRSGIGDFQSPGEFDVPPVEPVRLVGDIPWELREDG
jgi:pimeloyl-ACP methyl ester carboxylesterase